MTEDKGTIAKDTSMAQTNKVDSLLPPAKIHLFSDDLETLNLFHGMGEDWRFGRVSMGIRGDDLDQAIDHYSRRKSPTLVIIQTDTTNDVFQSRLADLADVCDEGTAAIIIGPVNDVQLYRHLTNIGISDYLVAPVASEDLINAIASSLQNIVGSVDSHLMSFIGVKGGVGTTCVSAIAAECMANHFTAKTLILDAAGANSTLWNHFEFSPSGTLIEAARAVVDHDMDALDRLFIKKSDYLTALNIGAENILDNTIATEAFEILLDHCLSIFPYVVMDLSSASQKIKRLCLTRSNSIKIVSTPRVPDLSLTKMMLKEIGDMPGSDSRKPSLIINKINRAKANDVASKDVKETFLDQAIIEFPWDGDLFSNAENNGVPLSTQSGYSLYSNILTPHLSTTTNMSHFKHDMTQKMNSGLLSIFNKMMGGNA